MIERRLHEGEIDEQADPERGYELQVLFDNVVAREYNDHPELNSRRKKLIFVLETFGWEASKMKLADLLGITEQETDRYLSRRGMRNEEFEGLRTRFDGLFAITSMIEAHVRYNLERRGTIVRAIPLLEDKQIRQMLQKGEDSDIHKAVYVAEYSYRRIHDQSY